MTRDVDVLQFMSQAFQGGHGHQRGILHGAHGDNGDTSPSRRRVTANRHRYFQRDHGIGGTGIHQQTHQYTSRVRQLSVHDERWWIGWEEVLGRPRRQRRTPWVASPQSTLRVEASPSCGAIGRTGHHDPCYGRGVARSVGWWSPDRPRSTATPPDSDVEAAQSAMLSFIAPPVQPHPITLTVAQSNPETPRVAQCPGLKSWKSLRDFSGHAVSSRRTDKRREYFSGWTI